MSDDHVDSHVLSDEQTKLVLETLQRYYRPESDDDRARYHAIRFICALSTARELIPLVASCMEAASKMMAHQDLSARVMYLAMSVLSALTGVEDTATLAVVEERLNEVAELVNDALRPQGGVS